MYRLSKAMGFLGSYLAVSVLTLTPLASLPAAASNDFRVGFFEQVDGVSTARFSQRTDAFYQDCPIRIGGVVVGFNTAARTDADGTHNRNGIYRTFVHNAGKLGKWTLTIQVQSDTAPFAPLPDGPVLQKDTDITAASLSAFPELVAHSQTDGVDYINEIYNGAPRYAIRTINANLKEGGNYITEWKGSGIFKNVNGLTVRCVFLIDKKTGDTIRCLDCLYYFGIA